MYRREEWAYGKPEETVVRDWLDAVGVADQDEVDRLMQIDDPLCRRRAAFDESTEDPAERVDVVRSALAGRLAPYVDELPDLPVALVHAVRRTSGERPAATSLQHLVEKLLDDGVESALWWEKIKLLSTEMEIPVVDDASCEVVRRRMELTGTGFCSPDFKAAILPPVPRRHAYPGMPAPSPVLTGPLDTPDTGSPFGGPVSPDRVYKLAAFYWAHVFDQFGLRRAGVELERRFLSGEVDLGAQVDSTVLHRVTRCQDTLSAERLDAIAERSFGKDSGFEEIVRGLGDAAGAVVRERRSATSRAVDMARLQQRVEEARSWCSVTACGVVAAAAQQVVNEATETFALLGEPEVACALNLGDCSASQLSVIRELTNDCDPKLTATTASDRATLGKATFDAIAVPPAPANADAWVGIAETAVQFAEAVFGTEDEHAGRHERAVSSSNGNDGGVLRLTALSRS